MTKGGRNLQHIAYICDLHLLLFHWMVPGEILNTDTEHTHIILTKAITNRLYVLKLRLILAF